MYSDIRHKIKSGDIIALSHSKWNSFYDLQVQAVRLFTQSEYCHVGLVWSVGGRLFVIESVSPKVVITPLSNYVKEGFYWIPVEKPMSKAEITFALSKVGKGQYSKWQAIKAQFNALKIGEDDLWECAEFIIACRKLSGVDLGNKATPSAVVKKLQEDGYTIHYINN